MANLQDCSVGYKKESVYGTAVTVDRWIEFLDESLDWKRDIKQGAGLRVGNGVARSTRRVTPTSAGEGEIEAELFSKGLGTLLELALGTGVSTVVAGSTYQQNFTIADNLPSATIQKGLVREGGTVDPYTFAGCVASMVEFTIGHTEIAKVKVGFDCKSMTTATAYAAPSYASGGSLYHWGQAEITLGGSVSAPTTTALASGGTAVTNVRDFAVKVDNKLTTDSYRMGGGGLKANATAGIRELTGTITVDYTDAVMRDAYVADTTVPMVLTLTSTEALSTGFAQFSIYLPHCRIDSALPKVNGGNLISTQYAFTVLDDTTNEPIVVSLRTADTAL